MSIVPVYIASPYNILLYFLVGQVHKDSKLAIMANVGKSRIAKIIFTNIHKISDAYMWKQFWQIHPDCTMYETCSSFLLNWSFSAKIVFHVPQHPQHYNNCSAPNVLILFKKLSFFYQNNLHVLLKKQLYKINCEITKIKFMEKKHIIKR